jgi:hypothetical protein
MFVSTLLLILIHINLTLQRTTKHSLSRTGFELACSGDALPIELSTQQVCNIFQKCHHKS